MRLRFADAVRAEQDLEPGRIDEGVGCHGLNCSALRTAFSDDNKSVPVRTLQERNHVPEGRRINFTSKPEMNMGTLLASPAPLFVQLTPPGCTAVTVHPCLMSLFTSSTPKKLGPLFQAPSNSHVYLMHAVSSSGCRWRRRLQFQVRQVQDQTVFVALRAAFEEAAVLLPDAGQGQGLVGPWLELCRCR